MIDKRMIFNSFDALQQFPRCVSLQPSCSCVGPLRRRNVSPLIFVVKLLILDEVDEPVDVAMHGGYCVLVCLDGGGVVMAGGKERQLSRQAVLVPACFGSFVVRPDAGMDLVLCAPFDVTVSPRA